MLYVKRGGRPYETMNVNIALYELDLQSLIKYTEKGPAEFRSKKINFVQISVNFVSAQIQLYRYFLWDIPSIDS